MVERSVVNDLPDSIGNLMLAWLVSSFVTSAIIVIYVWLIGSHSSYQLDKFAFYAAIYVTVELIQSSLVVIVIAIILRYKGWSTVDIRLNRAAAIGFVTAAVPWIMISWLASGSTVQVGKEILIEDGLLTAIGAIRFASEFALVGLFGAIAATIFCITMRWRVGGTIKVS